MNFLYDLVKAQWQAYKLYAYLAVAVALLSWHYYDKLTAVSEAATVARNVERTACVDAANKAKAVVVATYEMRAARTRADLNKRREEDDKSMRELEGQNAALQSAIEKFAGRKATAWTKDMAKELGR